MSRQYDFTFRLVSGASATTRGHGNTRTSAERAARRKLGGERHGAIVIACHFVKQDTRR